MMLISASLVLWSFIAIWVVIDNFRRREHSGVARAAWFVCIIFVPVIGVIPCLIARSSAADLVEMA
jgi:hypothetical protein